MQQEKRLVGSLYGSSNPLVDLPRLFALQQAGKLPIERLIQARRRLDEVNEAYEALRAGSVGRTVLLPG